jgi:hypothetical protein
VIPDGHAGLTGISFGFGHTPVVPVTVGAFVSGNDEVYRMDLTGYIVGPAWSAFVCNLDSIDHAFQVRFELDELRVGQPFAPTTALTVDQITSAVDQIAARDTPPPPPPMPAAYGGIQQDREA